MTESVVESSKARGDVSYLTYEQIAALMRDCSLVQLSATVIHVSNSSPTLGVAARRIRVAISTPMWRLLVFGCLSMVVLGQKHKSRLRIRIPILSYRSSAVYEHQRPYNHRSCLEEFPIRCNAIHPVRRRESAIYAGNPFELSYPCRTKTRCTSWRVRCRITLRHQSLLN